jgi:hypothetical protein
MTSETTMGLKSKSESIFETFNILYITANSTNYQHVHDLLLTGLFYENVYENEAVMQSMLLT